MSFVSWMFVTKYEFCELAPCPQVQTGWRIGEEGEWQAAMRHMSVREARTTYEGEELFKQFSDAPNNTGHSKSAINMD